MYNAWVQPVGALSDKIFDDEAIASNACSVAGWGVKYIGKFFS